MPNPRADEYRSMVDDELEAKLNETRQDLFNYRFRNVTGQLDNPSVIGRTKRDIARIETILRLREIEAAEAAEDDA
jgi:large subunit ribosomal protein L29